MNGGRARASRVDGKIEPPRSSPGTDAIRAEIFRGEMHAEASF